MTDRFETSPWFRWLGGIAVSVSLALSPQVIAQEESDDDEEGVEEIVVTGSRLKRDTYSSVSPLQIISGQVSREAGLIDAADILQESTASGGQQIDLTFQGFVLDNGPGATTINLRGLGSARTLVLINGRRVAPAGVEGAPVSPDLNLVPASLVQQYDLLLDGASSVYGSDAIAGVANIILRKDFDGFEMEAFSRVPEHDNGIDNTLSVIWGKNFDRGFIGVGAEFTDSERVTFDDRPWTAGCERPVEIDENGQIRTQHISDAVDFGMTEDGCARGLLAGRVSVPVAGSIYSTPGSSNGGWVGFTESNFSTMGIDSNGDGITDVSFRDYSLNGRAQFQDLFPEVETRNIMAYGEYTFDGEANITPFFEALYAQREFNSNSGVLQLFPSVPALNPFNICNPGAANGVDCGDAWDALMTNPSFVAQHIAAFGTDPSDPSTGRLVGSLGPRSVVPIVAVQGDRNMTDVSVDQLRFVAGVRGDMPYIDWGTIRNWSFEVSGSYSKSTGESSRPGIREDRLDMALGRFSSTTTPCVNDTGATLESDVAPGCVPVNLFAPSLYDGVIGDFATSAERDYLFDSRDFDTEYEQLVGNFYLTGDVFELPAGPVAAGFGYEYRDDTIASIPDAVARDGLFFGFFSDGGAEGTKYVQEAFGEIELPLLAGEPAFEELNLNLSARWTEDEIYGSEWTQSYKLGWRPVNSLLVRGTFGTSFRAPNLRELFLQDQSGFGNLFDPCLIPESAFDGGPGGTGYNPALDNRDPVVLANCLAQGVDPTVAEPLGSTNTYSVELAEGGSFSLDPEESESWSAGFAWDQPFTNAFDLSLSATYYEIEVINTIIEPTGTFIVNDCYNSPSGNSTFCSRIQRDASPAQPFMNFIDQGFLNRDKESARGVDINLAYDDSFTFFERPIDLGIDIVANRQLERSTLFIGDDGEPDFDTFHGEWGFPAWRMQGFLRFDYDEFRLTWETRYISSVKADPRTTDSFSDATNGNANTCSGAPNDVLCRDVDFTDNYFLSHLSLYYYGDRWTFGGGIRNIFDEEPPQVNGQSDEGRQVLSINNTPIGYGYDINGRTYFFNVAVNFGGGG